MNNKIFMNIEEIRGIISTLEMYKKEEDLILEDLNKYYENINYNYKTTNTDELDKTESQIINNINNIIKNHNNNIYVLNNNIETSLELERQAISELANI